MHDITRYLFNRMQMKQQLMLEKDLVKRIELRRKLNRLEIIIAQLSKENKEKKNEPLYP